VQKSRSVRFLLAGASAVALSASIAASALAVTPAQTYGPGGGGSTITVPVGGDPAYIVIDNYTVSGDVLNYGSVGTIAAAQDGIVITNGSVVTGSVINEAGGSITARNGGIGVQDSNVPIVINNGAVNVGLAGVGSSSAYGLGVRDSAGIPGGTSGLTNNGTINVTGYSGVTATGTAAAIGMGQEVSGGTGAQTVNQSNTGSINVTAQANVADAGSAQSMSTAAGLGQIVLGNATQDVNETIANSGPVDVTALGLASSSGGASATAAGFGVGALQVGTGQAVSESFSNTGAITVQTTLTATTSGNATAGGNLFSLSGGDGAAIGVGQIGFGGNTSTVALTGSNSGSITVGLSANAIGGVTANAGGLALGVGQGALGGVTNTAAFTNTGNLSVNATGNASGTNANVDVSSDGVVQVAAGGGNYSQTASSTFDNSGTVHVTASGVATASGNASIRAGAYGVDQGGFLGLIPSSGDAATSSAALTNSGTFTIAANAQGSSGTHVDAEAFVGGFYQDINDGGLGNASASVINSGTLTAVATAQAASPTQASAYASVDTGVEQYATGLNSAIASLTNSGTMTFVATATASSPVNAVATGEVYYGLYQTADATGGNATGSSASFDNTGSISFTATGSATATGTPGNATALAKFNYEPIYQQAEGGLSTSVALTNEGSLTFVGNATASGVTKAVATAYIDDSAIYQSAYTTNGNATSASVNLDNSGTLAFQLTANATATDAAGLATAYAYIDDTAIYQEAQTAQTASVNLTNSGTLTFALSATATAPAGAQASAYFDDYGIYQTASATVGNATLASVGLNNSGTLAFQAIANATSTGVASDATASAYFDEAALYQEANDGTTTSVSLTNSGTLTYLLSASATGVAGAYASAFYTDQGVYQSADGASGNTTLATVALNNSGTLALEATANATATGVGGTAEATAYFDETALYQQASGATTASVSLTNSGTLTFLASAAATAPGGASATAYFNEYGIYQSADSSGGNASIATVNLDNSGALMLAATATATVTGATGAAEATAYDYYQAIYQEASGANTASVSLTNSGTLGALVSANATAPGDAYAAAYYYDETALYQYADATGGNASIATVNLNNSGTLSLAALASATAPTGATGYAEAYAYFDEDAIGQYAEAAQTASVGLTNTGDLTLVASATASGPNYVEAEGYFDERGINQYASGTSGNTSIASVNLSNSGTLLISAMGNATSTGAAGTATAYGDIYSDGIEQEASNANTTSISLTNSGTLTIQGVATANAVGHAYASAEIDDTGIYQVADSTGGNASIATVGLTNSGALNVLATATATSTSTAGGGDNATANAYIDAGIEQYVYGANTPSASLTNSGAVTVQSSASATAGLNAQATGEISYGIEQYASGIGTGTATVALNNSGAINVQALAYADPVSNAVANALIGNNSSCYEGLALRLQSCGSSSSFMSVMSPSLIIGNVDPGYGILQEAYGALDGTVTLINSGNITVSGMATAIASDNAEANAYVGYGVYQTAQGAGTTGDASVSVQNSGLIQVMATATATAGTQATASAYVDYGVYQEAHYGSTDEASLTNSGTLSFSASGSATADFAYANATVDYGVDQSVFADGSAGSTASASLTNSGTFQVTAVANAAGVTEASATAKAYGVTQDVGGGLASNTIAFTNSGVFNVSANATAHASTANAEADAYGWDGYTNSSEGLNVTAVNSGNLTVSAQAVSDETANAYALGLESSAGNLTGSITNTASGTIKVSAVAHGTTGSATAVGVLTRSDLNTSTITNNGVIQVYAEGPTASATGIQLTTAGGGVFTPGVGNVTTVVNDGGEIWAGVSSDGGNTTLHGVAIDTTQSPNPVAINLMGTSRAGYIFGDINIGALDVITVSSGETDFNGLINDPVYNGTLTIANGGNLVLQDRIVGGVPFAAGGWVNQFNVNAGGTLTVELPSNGASPTPPAYPEIFANNATLAGNLAIRPQVGLFANTFGPYTIVDTTQDPTVPTSTGGTVTGTFAHVISPTPLLDPTVIYTADTAVLTIQRVPFNAVSGLTINQKSAATGIEKVYSTNLTGAFGNLVTNLFTQNAANYPHVLDQLAGAEYADYLQSLEWSVRDIDRIISERLDCSDDYHYAGSPGQCHLPGEASVWGRVSGGWGTQRGDVEAPKYSSTQASLTLGGDYAPTSAWVIGLAGGWVQDNLKFKTTGAAIDTSGWQAAVYTSYQPSEMWYLRGIATYGQYTGTGHRFIDIVPDTTGFSPGAAVATVSGRTHINLGADVFSAYAEAGRPFDFQAVTVTPFVGGGYTQASYHHATEAGVPGANLALIGSDASNWYTELGARFTGAWGPVHPQLTLAWQHAFGDERASYDALFADAPTSGARASFPVISARQQRDAAEVGLALMGGVHKDLEWRVAYDGRFNGDVTDHDVSLRLTYKFGGAAPPNL
jgi:hypothetical protein